MDDARRYQKELEAILQEVQARDEAVTQLRYRNREAARKAFEPHLNVYARSRGWTEERRLAKLEEMIDYMIGEKDPN
jgi:hypothetical protein